MALPLTLHQDEDRSVLMLDDSEDDDLLPPPRSQLREPRGLGSARSESDLQRKTKEAAANVPLHPIPAMQAAFAESLIEATTSPGDHKPKLRFADAKGRRNHLLDGNRGDRLYGALWRRRPGQKHHELWKLLAQVSFGVYLLLNGIANSNEQVVTILQGHIDEVDEFLETTLEDINLALEDVRERMDLLKLPMSNVQTFEHMLEDRNFRLQIVNGNEKIEHIISRTAAALEETLKDVDEGLTSTKEFAVYLGDQQDRSWRRQRPDIGDIFDAMKGNAQGWYKAFVDLKQNASALDALLTKLGQMVAEMDQIAGEVSRRTRFSVAPFSSPTEHHPPRGNPLSSSPPASTERSSVLRSPRSQSSNSRASSPLSSDKVIILQQQSPQRRQMAPKEETIRATVIRIGDDTPISKTQKQNSAEDEGLYLLQPRTYTPQPPTPIPSPRLQEDLTPRQEEAPKEAPKRTSLRQRVSLKGGNPPEKIVVPPRDAPELQQPRYQSSRHQSPQPYQGPDSAYGSDVEARPPMHSIAEPLADMQPPRFPNTIPSPRSDQQHYFPVRASPHSPLQQRPWTSNAAPPRPHTAHTARPGHHRNQPSAMGMSMLSNVTTLNPERKAIKKKRSAFGWLKKAFTLDEEERAEFEARKQQHAQQTYVENARSPKFLDGRRIPEYRQY
ncbi:hypothetical protein F4778DRAFT_322807 [Xylariomycetidae sp. FL2044]|nr:hypothetical protein F4778DRAFT_322807 [Xylariomycetidae sp. FL2044]